MAEKVDLICSDFPISNCIAGVLYSDGFNEHNKILVNSINSSHRIFLDVNSRIGSVLSRLEVGESEVVSGIGEITLLEKIDPYIATFRHAMEIRSSMNDGSDQFRQLTMPSGDDEVVAYITRFMQAVKGDDSASKLILEDISIPLSMRINHVFSNEPIKGSLICLSQKGIADTIKLYSDGKEIYDSFIVDPITASYLAATGLIYSIELSSLEIFITEDTYKSVKKWVDDVERSDYMTIDVSEHGLIRTTGDDLSKICGDFILGLKFLLETANVLELKVSDVPDNVVEYRRFFDYSLYSTYRASACLDIPWLCIDHKLASIVHSNGYSIINAFNFVNSNIVKIDKNKRLFGLRLNIQCDLSVPVLYSDIISLSMSSRLQDIYLVSEFIRKQSLMCSESGELLCGFLVNVNTTLVANAYLDRDKIGEDRTDFYRIRFIEKTFYYSCRLILSSNWEGTAEYKLSRFLDQIFTKVFKAKIILDFFRGMAYQFIIGHFLDLTELNKNLKSSHEKMAANKMY